MNEEGMMLRMNENGKFEEYKEPYCVIECPEKEDYDHIVEMVEKGEKMRWIPVEERMPEEGKNVLAVCYGAVKNITFKGAIQIAACYFDDGGWLIEGYEEMENPKVTHWMELPEFETEAEA